MNAVPNPQPSASPAVPFDRGVRRTLQVQVRISSRWWLDRPGEAPNDDDVVVNMKISGSRRARSGE